MSRVGKQIITIPSSVQINVQDKVVTAKNEKFSLTHELAEGVDVNIKDGKLNVTIADENDKQLCMLWGTTASIISNMIAGLVDGFQKQLEINGVGFKVAQSGQKLTFNLGFSHPIDFEVPKGIEAVVEKNLITIKGADKQLVGQVAARIRSLKKPEPYKGKGIKYIDEVIRRKVGKAAVSAE